MAEPTARAWRTLLAERAPLPGFLFIGAVQATSAWALFFRSLSVGRIVLATIGIAGLLLLMRLMDEVKDFRKDLAAHPGRPLPRGVISVEQVRRGMHVLVAGLLAYAAGVAVLANTTAGVLLAACVGYAYLMYLEFLAPKVVGRNAFFYALTHQVIVLPLYLFAVATVAPGAAPTQTAWWFALTGLGASFAFEVCRKLDPAAHPALGTYLHLYGRGPTVAAIVLPVLLLAWAAERIGVHPIVWPFAALLLLSLPLLYVRPGRYGVIAGLATLLAFVQMAAPALQRLLGPLL